MHRPHFGGEFPGIRVFFRATDDDEGLDDPLPEPAPLPEDDEFDEGDFDDDFDDDFEHELDEELEAEFAAEFGDNPEAICGELPQTDDKEPDEEIED